MKCRTFCGAPMEDGGAYCSKCGRRFSWPLTLSVVACTRIRLLSAINGLLAGGLPGAVFGDVCSLIFIVFLFGMLFLLWSAVTRAIAIHRNEELRPILFFDKAPIIHLKKREVC